MASLEKTIGALIREERQRQGISQEKLARKAGLHRQCVLKVESGASSPTLGTVRALAKALDVSEGWLLGRAAS